MFNVGTRPLYVTWINASRRIERPHSARRKYSLSLPTEESGFEHFRARSVLTIDRVIPDEMQSPLIAESFNQPDNRVASARDSSDHEDVSLVMIEFCKNVFARSRVALIITKRANAIFGIAMDTLSAFGRPC